MKKEKKAVKVVLEIECLRIFHSPTPEDPDLMVVEIESRLREEKSRLIREVIGLGAHILHPGDMLTIDNLEQSLPPKFQKGR